MTGIWEKLKKLLYNHNINLEARLGTVFIVMGVVAALLGLMTCVLSDVSQEGILLVFLIFIGTPVIMLVSDRLGEYHIGRIVMVIMVILLMPWIWVTSGGVESGVNIWFVFEFFFITLSLRGTSLIVAIILASIMDGMCYYLAWTHPAVIYTFPDATHSYISIIGSIITVTIITCSTVVIQKMIYNDEEKRLEEKQKELEKANSYQKSFLANMSHEIRSPINAVLGMNEMILRSDNIEEMKEFADCVQDAGQALLSLINDVLDYSKIESGKMEICCEEYETYSVIKSCYNLLALRASDKGLEFHVKNHPAVPKVLYGDENRIKQIITNLLTNALKYTDKGYMSLLINSERIDDENINLVIVVSDSGIGISKENMDKMFESFQRLDITRNKSVEGTGLGLAITRNLIALQGGTMEVKSEKGKGSLFTVKIPQKVVNSEGMGSFKKDLQKRVHNYQEVFHAPEAKILVVDDMKMNLVVVQGLLKKTQIKVDTALSGREAIEMTNHEKYDVILMDHMMPEMDGIETFKVIQENGNANKNTPTIMLTANAISGAQNEYLAVGFTDYMTKPIKPELLEKLLKQYIPKEKIEKVE